MKKIVVSFNILTSKVPVYFLALCMIFSFAISYLLFSSDKSTSKPNSPVSTQAILSGCELNQIRLKNYDLVHKLILVDMENESEELQGIKTQLNNFISAKENDGTLKSASVYLRRLNSGEWINVGSNEKYNPASLFKIPLLITILKMADQNPEILNQKLIDNIPHEAIPDQTFEESCIVYGKSYSIKELLYQMIVYSDNYATSLLHKIVDINTYNKTYSDLGLTVPVTTDFSYGITAKDFSRFLRVLYNGSYLNLKNSEYALTLLTKSSFKEGIVNGVPSDIVVAHKFGERRFKDSKQIHESGIVYINNDHPYIITVMTEGTDSQILSDVVSDISALVYKSMTEMN